MSLIASFDIPVGGHVLTVPCGATDVPLRFWDDLLKARLRDELGYGREALQMLGRLEAWLRAPIDYAAWPGEDRKPKAAGGIVDPLRWVLLRVTPRQERFVAKTLTEKGVIAYVPIEVIQIDKTVRKVKRKHTRERPLIPGYVFALLPDDDALDIARDIRPVLQIMCDGQGNPRKFPLLELGSLILAEAFHDFDDTWEPPKLKGQRYSHRWVKGERVKIAHGPFAGFEGEVTHVDRKDRIRVAIAIFGRFSETNVESADIRAATSAGSGA